MAIIVILVLGVLWAAVLLPPILRSRNASGMGGVSDFMDSLKSLGRGNSHRSSEFAGPVLHGPVGMGTTTTRAPVRAPGYPIAPPMTYRRMPGGISPMQRRRRNVLFGLGSASGLTFLFALLAGSIKFWLLFLVVLGVSGAYVYLLIQFKEQAASKYSPGRRVHATPIALEDDDPQPAKVGDNVVLLRRSVG